MDHGNLLVERHPTECIVDTLLHRYRLIEILGQLLSLCAGSDHQCYDYTLNFQHQKQCIIYSLILLEHAYIVYLHRGGKR